ncbi:MAG: hypothetical protein IJ272_06800 [Clostridia bacterium]|nr:hypothetical protein [Clostridia bacterium]
MTNEQLTQELISVKEHQAKCDAERENILTVIKEIQEDIKSTKSLAEDVHIMAINMKNMQETLSETNKKVNAITSQEFVEYKENKKLVKQNIINKVTGTITGAIITGLVWLIVTYINTH